MNQEKISLISTLVNFLLTGAKLVIGLSINSVALIADAIHSGMDIFSSLVTFLGIKAAKKPVDEKHPYGYYRTESLAGLVVAILLGLSGVWIIYEGANRFLEMEPVVFSLWAIGLMVATIIINEVMARLKFHYGRKHESLSLVADAEHSRADVISSVGVLVSLVAVRYFVYADAFIALLIGLYILKETFGIGKEITDSLLDVANPELEVKIKEIVSAQKVEMADLKTRKIGGANFAELKIKLDPKLKLDRASELAKSLKNQLLDKLPQLKYVVISVESHEIKEGTIVRPFGQRAGFRKGFELIGPKKSGQRTIIPLADNEISQHLGAADYLVIDRAQDGSILKKEKVKNPYFTEETGHGFKFVKSISADKVMAREIGPNAQRNFEAYNIELELIGPEKKLEDILKELT
jgi:cation diffusion facilitator family transporter